MLLSPCLKYDRFAEWIWPKEKIIAYVKDEGFNLNATTSELKSIMNCEVFGLEESFLKNLFWSCFFQIMSIWHNNEKVCEIWNMVLLNLHKHISRNASLGQQNMGRESKKWTSLCWGWINLPKETKYPNENKVVNFVYLKHIFNLKTFVFDYVRLNTKLIYFFFFKVC
jgi:hypothetical protein